MDKIKSISSSFLLGTPEFEYDYYQQMGDVSSSAQVFLSKCSHSPCEQV